MGFVFYQQRTTTSARAMNTAKGSRIGIPIVLVTDVPRDKQDESRVASSADVPERPACCLT
jgi:hypothetical protein